MYTGVEVLNIGVNECTIRCLGTGTLTYVYTGQEDVLTEDKVSSRVSAGEVLTFAGRPVFASVTNSIAYTITDSGAYAITYAKDAEEVVERMVIRRGEKIPYHFAGWILASVQKIGSITSTRARPTLTVYARSADTPTEPVIVRVSDLMNRRVRNIELRDRNLLVAGVPFDITYYEEQTTTETATHATIRQAINSRSDDDLLIQMLGRQRNEQSAARYRIRALDTLYDDSSVNLFNSAV